MPIKPVESGRGGNNYNIPGIISGIETEKIKLQDSINAFNLNLSNIGRELVITHLHDGKFELNIIRK